MSYELTSGTGLQPFVADAKRGHWAHPNDFIYAGIALVLRMDFSARPYTITGNVVVTPIYLLALALYIVPIMVIQSFLGQFSSSSYISAFRLAPLFKGVGYVTLAINLSMIVYYSIFAVIPLAYLFASMQPTLPWSCEGLKKWATNLTEEEKVNLCNMKLRNAGENDTYYEYINNHIPSALYFKQMFNDKYLFDNANNEVSMSWNLVLYFILVWALIAAIIYKFFETEKMGHLIRYCVWIFLSLLVVCLIRFSFLTGSGIVYYTFFKSQWIGLKYALTLIPIYGLSAFGPGWGVIITLSSFNKFKTDIRKTSWIIGLTQMLVIVALNLITLLVEQYVQEVTGNTNWWHRERATNLYLSSGSVIAEMEWPNFWSILFFLMLFVGASLLIAIQLFSILTTIFDEFDSIREHKRRICMMLTGAVALCSFYFTSSHGIKFYRVLSGDFVITQNALYALLIIIVLWVYGVDKFVHDMVFMVNKSFSISQVYVLKWVILVFALLALLTAAFISFLDHVLITHGTVLLFITFVVLPWVFIPLYALYSMFICVGTIKQRSQNCCRPSNWYPVDADERERYLSELGNTGVIYNPNAVNEEL